MTRSFPNDSFPYELLEDPEELGGYRGWSEEIYREFLAIQRGELAEETFESRYRQVRSIFVLDTSGFTDSTARRGTVASLLRIFDFQKVCIPVLKEQGALLIRAFADDLVALYSRPEPALEAAFEIHRRIRAWNTISEGEAKPEACIGIGFGSVYAIGPNLSMGLEMNQTSKLGEDTARGGETLVTQNAYDALQGRAEVRFEAELGEELGFRFYRASLKNA